MARMKARGGEEIRNVSRTFGSDFSRSVFEDSTITEQEFAEAKNIVVECFNLAGLDPTWDEYGYLSIESDSATPPKAMAECQFADGGVMMLYQQMKANPDHLDVMEIRVECLIREGIVEPGYTANDLENAYADESVSMLSERGGAIFDRCVKDPLGATG